MPSLEDAMKKLNERYGDNSVVRMDDEHSIDVEAIPTGSMGLDSVFGCGGIPRGRVIEVFGQESSGKSTLALYIVAQVQASGGKCVWIDTEGSYTTEYSRQIGVNTDELIVAQPMTGEEALDIANEMAKTGEVDLIVLDSVASLVPKAELEGDIVDQQMALQARMMGKALRMITGTLTKKKTSVVMLNQVRDKIGVFYGSKTTTPGGKALRFYASVRLEVKKLKTLKDKDGVATGTIMGVCAVKNKVSAPFRTTEMQLIFGKGIDTDGELFDVAVAKGIIAKEGNTYTYEGEKLGVGLEKAKEALRTNEELKANVRSRV